MIERQIFGGKFLAAVLTRVIIARIDVGARKLHSVVILDANVFQETNDRGQFDGKRYGVDLLIVFLDDFDLPGKKQCESFLPGDDTQRFIRSIQQQCRLHS